MAATNMQFLLLKPNTHSFIFSPLSPLITQSNKSLINPRKNPDFISHVIKQKRNPELKECNNNTIKSLSETNPISATLVICTLGVTSISVAAIYHRISCPMEGREEINAYQMLATFAVFVGSAVGMEFWARWAHRVLWHGSLWYIHKSHHRFRDGTFELNDVFAIINSVPAIALISYGYFNEGFVPELCFGAGLGITVLGMAYVFVHDGLIHGRFSVGPIADIQYFQTVAAAHKELEEVAGGLAELKKEIIQNEELLDGL